MRFNGQFVIRFFVHLFDDVSVGNMKNCENWQLITLFEMEAIQSLAKLCLIVLAKRKWIPFELVGDTGSIELKQFFYKHLSPDFDLKTAVTCIQDELYWKIRFQSNFPQEQLTNKPEEITFKVFYLQLFTKKFLEFIDPELDNDEENDIIETIKIMSPFVKSLKLDNFKTYKSDDRLRHALFELLFKKYLKHFGDHLDEFDLVIQEKNLNEMTFDKSKFQLTLTDCTLLANGTLNEFKMLTILRINNRFLNELSLSHCGIRDFGAKCIAHQIYDHPNLQILNLCNNNIESEGCRYLGFALMQPECKLTDFNVRLNPIGGLGVLELCCSLVRSSRLIELLISACNIDTIHTLRVAQMIALNCSLQFLDVSNNNTFDLESSQVLLGNILTKNRTLIKLDLRNTNMPKNMTDQIKNALIEREYSDMKNTILIFE